MKTLLDNFTEGILVFDSEGLISFANQKTELIFGRTQDELIGESLESLFPSQNNPFIEVHRVDNYASPEGDRMPAEIEGVGRGKDGKDILLRISLFPLNNEDGGYFVCLLSEPSGLAREKHIKFVEDRFERLFRAFPMPTYIWQRKGDDFILIDYNLADKSYSNAAIKYFLGRSVHDMYPDGGAAVEGIERCYRQKSHFTEEMLGHKLQSTGEVKDLVVTYIWIDPDLVVVALEDVTRKRATLSELKKLSSAVEQTADAVFITDRDGTIEYVNPGFEKMMGYLRSEVIGQNPRLFKSGDMRPGYYDELWQTILKGEPFQSQTINHKKDGTKLIVEQTITPMKDQSGQLTHFVSVLKDMTERISLQEQETENRLAARIQQELFPKQSPKIEGYDIAGAVFPASTVSGDYFDYISLQDGTLGIVVGDVSGHGMGPALIVSEARAYLRSITRYSSEPRSVLRELNAQLAPDIADTGFITMFFARLDSEKHIMDSANAGNWPAYIIDARGEVIQKRSKDSIPIGLLSDLTLEERPPILLQPGSLAVIITDGFPEANNENNKEFGAQRVLSIISQHRLESAQKIIELIRGEVVEFLGSAEQSDDQTIVICKRLPVD